MTLLDPTAQKYAVKSLLFCGWLVAVVMAAIMLTNVSDCTVTSSAMEWPKHFIVSGFSNATDRQPGLSNTTDRQPDAELCQRATNEHRNASYRSEREMFEAARDAASQPLPRGKPRIAFLFLVRDFLPHEPLWRRFFANYSYMYSIYVHAKPGFEFPESSFFKCKEIPSKTVGRFSMNMVDAMRRLLAHALLDTSVPNVWFVFACESSIPIRSFPYVYDYLMSSNLSFVESFRPVKAYDNWNTLPEFPQEMLRKGELWKALLRRHAGMVMAETTIYNKFEKECKFFCTPDEQYMQTLLAIEDPRGIANRTIMYVDWSREHTGSPLFYNENHVSPELIWKIQNKTLDSDGERHDTSRDEPGEYRCAEHGNGRPECFLFARKFTGSAAAALQGLAVDVLGY